MLRACNLDENKISDIISVEIFVKECGKIEATMSGY